MTREETLETIKLMSALESCLLVCKVPVPDHIWEVFARVQSRLEHELFDGVRPAKNGKLEGQG